MIYILPTKRGLGVEIWGTRADLDDFYSFISKFWNDESKEGQKEFQNRNELISGFSYEIRKAKEGSRLKRGSNHFSFEKENYFGTQISWVHFLFSLTAIKFNMRFYETNKFDVSLILLIEYWLENSMSTYDSTGAKKMLGFIEGGLYGANEYIYQYMRSINVDYYVLGGGKRAFRKLPELLKRGIFYSQEYQDYKIFLQEEAKRLNCQIDDLELNDEHIDYEKIKW